MKTIKNLPKATLITSVHTKYVSKFSSRRQPISPAIDRLLMCGHNRRGTEKSKLGIFEIDLLIV